ncbi:MAG: hypothetical protein ACRD97_05725 [Nitrososphaeraceae archaeon]
MNCDVVLPISLFMRFTHSFLLANKVCHASTDCNCVTVHINPVVAIAIIAIKTNVFIESYDIVIIDS